MRHAKLWRIMVGILHRVQIAYSPLAVVPCNTSRHFRRSITIFRTPYTFLVRSERECIDLEEVGRHPTPPNQGFLGPGLSRGTLGWGLKVPRTPGLSSAMVVLRSARLRRVSSYCRGEQRRIGQCSIAILASLQKNRRSHRH